LFAFHPAAALSSFCMLPANGCCTLMSLETQTGRHALISTPARKNEAKLGFVDVLRVGAVLDLGGNEREDLSGWTSASGRTGSRRRSGRGTRPPTALARLTDPNKLVIETCGATSARISEVTGLMIKHFDPATRTIRIEQRNWRMDIDEPKTEGSKRILALGDRCERYLEWIAKLDRRGPNDSIFPQTSDAAKPLWD